MKATSIHQAMAWKVLSTWRVLAASLVVTAALPVFAVAGGPGCDGKGKGGAAKANGGRGFGRHAAHRLLGLNEVLDYLAQEDVPATFTAELFPDADLDESGSIEVEEWNAFAEEKVTAITTKAAERNSDADVDEDGVVTLEELNAFVDEKVELFKEKLAEFKPELDVDEDGVLSDEEYAAAQAEKLTHMLERHPEADLNADGELTSDELVAARLSNTIERPKHDRGRGRRGHRGFGRRGGGRS